MAKNKKESIISNHKRFIKKYGIKPRSNSNSMKVFLESLQKEKVIINKINKKEAEKIAKKRNIKKNIGQKKKEQAKIKKQIDELMEEVKMLNNQFNRFDIIDIEE